MRPIWEAVLEGANAGMLFYLVDSINELTQNAAIYARIGKESVLIEGHPLIGWGLAKLLIKSSLAWPYLSIPALACGVYQEIASGASGTG